MLFLDDAHWADVPSLRALLFVVRRLVADRVLVVTTTREHAPGLPEGFVKAAAGTQGRRLQLQPLTTEELRALAAAQGVRLSARAIQRLEAHAGGNPLYTRALLDELPAGRLAPAGQPPGAALVRRHRPAARRGVLGGRGRGCWRRWPSSGRAPRSRSPRRSAGSRSRSTRSRRRATRASCAGSMPRRSRLRRSPIRWSPPRSMTRSGPAGAPTCTRWPPSWSRTRARRCGISPRPPPAPTPSSRSGSSSWRSSKAAGQCMESAAMAMVSASRLSPARPEREERLLRAVDWMLAAGDAAQARAHAGEVAGFAEGARRYSIVGQLASLDGRIEEATRAVRPGVGVLRPRGGPAARRGDRAPRSPTTRCASCATRTWWSGTAERSRSRPTASSRSGGPRSLAISLWRLGRADEAYRLLEESRTSDRDDDLHLLGMRGWLRFADDELENAPRRPRGGRGERAAARRAARHLRAPDRARARAVRHGRLGRRDRVGGAGAGARVRDRASARRLRVVVGDPRAGGARRLGDGGRLRRARGGGAAGSGRPPRRASAWRSRSSPARAATTKRCSRRWSRSPS